MASQAATATAAAAAPTTGPAPWRAQFLEHVGRMDQPSFTLASLHAVDNHSAPRARTCIFRGMWATSPDNPRSAAPRNPDALASDCLALTTDARMAKVPEVLASGGPHHHSHGVLGVGGSGGGGPVEALFWVAPAQAQWRVRGRAWVLSPSDVDDGNSGGAKAARQAISGRMRRADGGGGAGEEAGRDGGWSWGREVACHFGNLSPAMRGSFRNPPPGTPRAGAPGPGEGLGQKVGDELLGDEVARKNFRVVVIVPEEVDMCDLSDPADQRRWLYTYLGPAGKASKKTGGEVIDGWEKVEVWP